jgi:hypothetical protein
VFELGIGTTNTAFAANMGVDGKPGASLHGWAEFFPHAKIFGADIDKEILFHTDRITTYYCDQTNATIIRSMWENEELREGFDLIVDDGYHNFSANVCFFENSIHKLNPNGYYIIEDIQYSDIKLMENQVNVWKERYPNFAIEFHKREYNHRVDNNVVVIQNTLAKYNSDISMIYYINIDHRTDRKEHIEEQLRLANIPSEKIYRISASYRPTFGMLGCVESHIHALELAYESGNEYVVIMEDDFTFNRPASFLSRVESVLRNYKPSIIHLAYMTESKQPSHIPGLCKLTKSLTTSGYLIHRSYIPTVLANFKESMAGLVAAGKIGEYNLDEYWAILQKKDDWYGFIPNIGYQMESYSDNFYKKNMYTVTPDDRDV